VSSRAGSRLATQTYAISAQSAPATLAAFESLILRSGWRQDSPAAAGAAAAAAAATRVRTWRRGDEELLAVVAEGRPTTLLIHHVRPASAVQERP
jgi:hypothetical protein